MKKIAIDCRMIDSSGIGTYLSGVLPHLLKEKNEYLLIGSKEKLNKFKDLENVKLLENNIKIFSIKEFLNFPTKEINKCDIFYTPFFNIPNGIKIPIYSTIHDVVFLDMPELTSKVGYLIRKYFYKRAYRISKKIFTVSEFSKKRIEFFLGTDKEIIITYNGVADYILEEPDEKYTKKDYLIFVGNIKKHKGLKTLLQAFTELKKEGLSSKLVIVGNQKNFKTADKEVIKILEDKNLNKDIQFTGYVDNEKLKKLIAEAKILVQPSLYEGFGIPPLEALTLGTSVILSDIDVFKEIYSDFEVEYFKVNEIDSLYKKIMKVSNNYLIEKVKEKYSYFNVAKTIKEGLKNGK